jgi:hypothetical protein
MAALDSPLYLVIKLLAYCIWCFVGLRMFQSDARFLPAKAIGFGVIRFFMGFFFGIAIYFLGSLSLTVLGSGLQQNIVTYLLVYVPVRWIEWSIMSLMLASSVPHTSSWLLGWNFHDRRWRAGGIFISCLADIPLIASLGGLLPTGRFLC